MADLYTKHKVCDDAVSEFCTDVGTNGRDPRGLDFSLNSREFPTLSKSVGLATLINRWRIYQYHPLNE
jgi:hypothetical protein